MLLKKKKFASILLFAFALTFSAPSSVIAAKPSKPNKLTKTSSTFEKFIWTKKPPSTTRLTTKNHVNSKHSTNTISVKAGYFFQNEIEPIWSCSLCGCSLISHYWPPCVMATCFSHMPFGCDFSG